MIVSVGRAAPAELIAALQRALAGRAVRQVPERPTGQLQEGGLEFTVPQATFYIWVRVPTGYTSASFTDYLLDQSGIMVTPGHGFGKTGEGYIRVAFTFPDEQLQEAARRLAALKKEG